MTDGLYSTSLPIRPEIAAAHRDLIDHWASTGAWWTGTERLAIVTQVRLAEAADGLPPWQSPLTVDGLIDPDVPLPAAAIDVIWRLTNHPGTITEAWYHEIITAGLEPEAYVELVAVVAMANALDHFGRALGLDRLEAPPARSGEPIRLPPAESMVVDHWVPTVEGVAPNIRKAVSVTPAEMAMQATILDAQYVPGGALAVELTEKVWSLDRMQMELVASRVSTLNECFY